MSKNYSQWIVGLLLAVALIEGVVIAWSMSENGRLRRELAERTGDLRLVQKRSLRLESDLKKSSAVIESAAETNPQDESAATAESEAPVPKDKSPKVDFKKMMTGKLGEIIARSSVSSLYGDFFSEVKLSPDERQRLQEILVEQQCSEMRRQSAAAIDGTSHAEQEKLIKAAANAKVKQLLGNDRFQQYLTYTEQIPDRMKVSYFNDLLATSNAPIQPEQKKQLLNVVLDERKKFDAERKSAGTAAAQSNADFYQRLGNRWAGVLTPEQLIEYNKWKDAMVEYVRFMETGETKASAPAEATQ